MRHLQRRDLTESDVRARVAALDWWHTIELPGGIVTPGSWDLRPTAARVPWPRSLAGLRCLDVGTMDGFWAFELESLGAGEVLAIDVADPARQDAPYRRRDRPGGRRRGETFRVAAEALGSKAELRDSSVYDLDAADLGQFDLVVVGYVLQLLRDPLRALEAIRDVCQGWLIVVDTISAPLSLLPTPLARLCARRGFLEWFVFNRRGLEKALELTGFRVETAVRVRDCPGPADRPRDLPLRMQAGHAVGLLGRSLAVRARADSGG